MPTIGELIDAEIKALRDRVTVLEGKPPVVTPPPPPPPPPPTGSAVPELAAWQANMLKYGALKGDQFALASQRWLSKAIDPGTGKPYGPDLALAYDPTRVFEQIGRYTNDPKWYGYADKIAAMYRDGYVIPNNGGVNGIYRYTRGLRLHAERTGDAKSKQAVQLVRDNGAYANPGAADVPGQNDVGRQREIAYLLNAYTDAEALGIPPTAWGPARKKVIVTQAYGHLAQMIDKPNGWKNGAVAGDGGAQISPFMFALGADALIDDWKTTKDPRLIPAIVATANFFWTEAWRAADQSMTYQVNPKNTTGDMGNLAAGSPDLNLLIAPIYEFLYGQTKDPVHRQRGDALFVGGVKKAWLDGGNPKQFLESYKDLSYVKMRVL